MATRLLSRRSLLRLLIIAVPAITIPPAIRLGGLDLFTRESNLDLREATDSTFSSYLGHRFSVRGAAVSHLDLQEMVKRGPASFSLFFGGPSIPALGQGTYTFEHSELGRFPLFIVPARNTGGGRQAYEAVINHEDTIRVAA